MLNITASVIFGLMMVLHFAPKSALAKALQKYAIDRAVRGAIKVQRRHVLLAFFALASLPFAFQFAIMAGTLDAAFIYASHLAVYGDILLVSLTAIVSLRVRLLSSFFKAR